MGRKRKFGRKLDGVVVIDKPAGATSNAVLQRAKRLFFANKAGHSGSLDPLATGVLPLCFGEATKFAQFLLDADKEYYATMCFGQSRDTGDSEGEIVAECDASALTQKDLERTLTRYRGAIQQVPPMYSALKQNGKPLYELARQGIEVEREAREVHIFEFELLAFRPGKLAEMDCKVRCSKGTYIRSLAEDIGRDVKTGGHLSALRRSQAGPFRLEQALDLDKLEAERGEQRAEVLDAYLLPVDSAVKELAALELPANSAFYFSQGQAVMDGEVYRHGEEGDMVRVFDDAGEFLGLGEITDEGCIAPRRLMAN